MLRVLISFRDPILGDIVGTALKQFPALSAYRLPQSRVCEVIASDDYDAIILDLRKGDDGKRGLIHEIREISQDIEIFGLVDRGIKEKFNRFKLEQSLFSIHPLPIEPFSFAKGIARLEVALKKASAKRQRI